MDKAFHTKLDNFAKYIKPNKTLKQFCENSIASCVAHYQKRIEMR